MFYVDCICISLETKDGDNGIDKRAALGVDRLGTIVDHVSFAELVKSQMDTLKQVVIEGTGFAGEEERNLPHVMLWQYY